MARWGTYLCTMLADERPVLRLQGSRTIVTVGGATRESSLSSPRLAIPCPNGGWWEGETNTVRRRHACLAHASSGACMRMPPCAAVRAAQQRGPARASKGAQSTQIPNQAGSTTRHPQNTGWARGSRLLLPVAAWKRPTPGWQASRLSAKVSYAATVHNANTTQLHPHPGLYSRHWDG